MSGGPIAPTSIYIADTTGKMYPLFYGGAGGNVASHDEGIGIQASLAGDVTVELRFPVPPTVPTGTLKMRLLALASATSNSSKCTVKDANVAAGASPSAATLTSESQTTITWAAGDTDKYKEAKVTLTGSSGAAGNDMIVAAITFQTSGWTLAAESCWIVTIIWE